MALFGFGKRYSVIATVNVALLISLPKRQFNQNRHPLAVAVVVIALKKPWHKQRPQKYLVHLSKF